MKKILVLVMVAVGAVVIARFVAEQQYSVAVTGSKGIPFSGTCLVWKAGSSSSHDAIGTVPLTLHLSGSSVSCVVQKTEQGGVLEITIEDEKGRLVAESLTYAPYGVASAAGQ